MSATNQIPHRDIGALRSHLSHHLASASAKDPTNWQFVPPCLISTTSGALSPHIFHKSLEKIHCDRTLYPHHEEDDVVEAPGDGDEKQTFSPFVPGMRDGRYDSKYTRMAVDVQIEPKDSESKAQQQALVQPQASHFRLPNSPKTHHRNRGRLASSRWTFVSELEWQCEEMFCNHAGDSGWKSHMHRDGSTAASQERRMVFGSYIVVVGLILLSFWVLARHTRL